MYRVSERTRGTETSKYPEEKKETSIPSVAASEIGRAQTGLRVGVVGTNMFDMKSCEYVGKRNHSR